MKLVIVQELMIFGLYNMHIIIQELVEEEKYIRLKQF